MLSRTPPVFSSMTSIAFFLAACLAICPPSSPTMSLPSSPGVAPLLPPTLAFSMVGSAPDRGSPSSRGFDSVKVTPSIRSLRTAMRIGSPESPVSALASACPVFFDTLSRISFRFDPPRWLISMLTTGESMISSSSTSGCLPSDFRSIFSRKSDISNALAAA